MHKQRQQQQHHHHAYWICTNRTNRTKRTKKKGEKIDNLRAKLPDSGWDEKKE